MTLTTLQNGRYRIECILGQGGFGITYRAVQSSLGRTVAIKEFFMKDYCERVEDSSHVTMGTQSSREMVLRYRDKFEKEARTLAKLEHPHIVRVIDVFQENNTSYYVMEYAEGMSLKQRVDEGGALSEAEAVNYISQVADALKYLHIRNICHLDVKPANILTRSNGDAILADFGLAKQYDEEGGETSTTPIGRSKGYAPPEQYMTEGIKDFSPETDVYALGATLYFLLTGNTPPESVLLNEQNLDLTLLPPRMMQVIQTTMQFRRADRAALAVFEKLLDKKTEQIVSDEDDVTIMDVKPIQDISTGKKKLFPSLISYNCYIPVILGIIVIWGIYLYINSSKTEHSTYEEVIPSRVEEVCLPEESLFTQTFKAAERGDVTAQLKLGDMYYSGNGTTKDNEKALNWYTKAAKRGNVEAQFKLAEMYDKGIGIQSRNETEAVKWYEKAAIGGHADAQDKLGDLYYFGWGVPENIIEAIKWYEKAADKGNMGAIISLGNIYSNGSGDVPQNKAEAIKWYQRGAERGNAYCIRQLKSNF
ncbi:MAG: SEL1-like repeat protein [Candidatus Paraprevotella stercoravium]|uniref:SEL1-like repeat protein n=1 Tax=Candidatus Paraprevotella stercoravium TaxID=2838725 RepID=A0A9E2P377_9BACT|nr:SEL1-like repeat protein [Candidatus Paraprevotella stercoravium]